MAIKILDPVETDYSVSLSNLICSLGGSLSVCKHENGYRVSSNASLRADVAGARPVKHEYVSVDVSAEQLAENLFPLLYAVLKAKYANHEDC